MPPNFLVEVRTLVGAGFTVLEIAEHFGVDRSTMYRQRNYAPEFMQSLKEGRGAFVALEVALRAREAVEAAEQTRRAAREARALFEAVEVPAPVEGARGAVGQVRSPEESVEGGPTDNSFSPPIEPLRGDYEGPGAAIPMDDPLGRW
ncbi:hypothetical protein ASC89_04275 [Devosia sp. Root413D1]|nr:hypothetical protein ASC89_04275 [Devosia sp. Root413D1]